MKIATIIIRSLIGLLLLFSSISYFLHLFPEPPLSGNMKLFNDGIKASVYLMPLVKTIEFTCGLSFITGKFNKLTYILINARYCQYHLYTHFSSSRGHPSSFLFVDGKSILDL
jgi:putative oxidoreductase